MSTTSQKDIALEALEEIAALPCETLNGGECPDYWAIGLSKDPCPSCIARDAAKELYEHH